MDESYEGTAWEFGANKICTMKKDLMSRKRGTHLIPKLKWEWKRSN